jgi:methylated-DNA-[protein]-cysteine S-methyltransferase
VAGPTLARVPNTSRAWAWTTYESPVGPLFLAATRAGVVRVGLRADARAAARAVHGMRSHTGIAPLPRGDGGTEPHAHLTAAREELEAYFAGRLRTFAVPLDWSLTAGFPERVLRELAASVPYGATTGYQELARRAGEAGAARAVGAAMGANPLPLFVPCHRVVESGGGLGGFGGGTEMKRALLALEGVLPAPLF